MSRLHRLSFGMLAIVRLVLAKGTFVMNHGEYLQKKRYRSTDESFLEQRDTIHHIRRNEDTTNATRPLSYSTLKRRINLLDNTKNCYRIIQNQTNRHHRHDH